MPSTSYNLYYQELKRRKEPFDCPVCDSTVLPGQFEKHGVDPKRVCVWCREYSFSAKTKKLHYNHLRSCFVRFMNSLSTTTAAADLENPPAGVRAEATLDSVMASTSTTSVEPTLLSMEHLYPERANVEKLADSSWSTVDFEPTLLDLQLPALRFQDENLNLAIACVRAYLETCQTHAWIHAVVRGVAVESFLAVLLQNRRIRTLPFSCWCDGGLHETRYRQHRHFLVVSPSEERFRRAFAKVKMSDREAPMFHYPVKRFTAIKDAMHFVNALGYVSHPKSSCRFVAAVLQNKTKTNHFHLYKTLPENYRLPLVLQWDGGVAELLYQEKLQNVSVTALAKSVRRMDGSRWGMELGLFYGLERGKVLPVETKFLPTSEPTSYFLHLTSGRKLYFSLRQEEEEEMRREDWLRLQAEGGNVFYDAVAGDVWHPRKRDQKFLNQLRPLMDQVEEMKDKIKHLEENEATLKRRLEEAEREIVSLKRRPQNVD